MRRTCPPSRQRWRRPSGNQLPAVGGHVEECGARQAHRGSCAADERAVGPPPDVEHVLLRSGGLRERSDGLDREFGTTTRAVRLSRYQAHQFFDQDTSKMLCDQHGQLCCHRRDNRDRVIGRSKRDEYPLIPMMLLRETRIHLARHLIRRVMKVWQVLDFATVCDLLGGRRCVSGVVLGCASCDAALSRCSWVSSQKLQNSVSRAA